jgi:hypothetical protein
MPARHADTPPPEAIQSSDRLRCQAAPHHWLAMSFQVCQLYVLSLLLSCSFLAHAAGPSAAVSAAAEGDAPPDQAQSLPKLTYRKVLKGSVPEYTSITVDSSGSGQYEGRKLDDPSDPRPLKLSEATTKKLFELAAQLDNFKLPGIESHKKVANLGLKSFIYQSGQQKNEVEFNYTLNRDAQELSDQFEKIAAVEVHLDGLQYAIKYDHLGLPRELLQIQVDLDNNALVEPELLVPTLDQIARNHRFLHLAQVRAQNILERLQNDR